MWQQNEARGFSHWFAAVAGGPACGGGRPTSQQDMPTCKQGGVTPPTAAVRFSSGRGGSPPRSSSSAFEPPGGSTRCSSSGISSLRRGGLAPSGTSLYILEGTHKRSQIVRLGLARQGDRRWSGWPTLLNCHLVLRVNVLLSPPVSISPI